MKILVCGSIAYDHIMVFPDYFKNHILPNKVHILNISFLAPKMLKEFGGCAGNIAYGLNLLKPELGFPMATVGKDFTPYEKWLKDCGINQTHIRRIDNTFTAQAFITTDLDDNQITTFHPGAMEKSHKNNITSLENYQLGIISPDGYDGMLLHAKRFSNAKVPFVFDPGQSIPLFNKKELISFIEKSNWIIVNEYEWQLVKERTKLKKKQLSKIVDALIITRGSKGSDIYTRNKKHHIPIIKPKQIVDPTGCGDAYRAGLLYGLSSNIDIETTGRIASLMGAIKIETHGTQNYNFTIEKFKKRFKSSFGYMF